MSETNLTQQLNSDIPPRIIRLPRETRATASVKESLELDVFGQSLACETLARSIVRARSGLADPRKPLGSFLFLGPTGVGKTEAAKALTRVLFGKGWEQRFMRIDCSTLTEPHSVSRLKGSDPSYVGYGDPLLIDPNVLRRGAVVCFDEIEKADRSVHRWLLPVLDEGTATVYVPTNEDKPSGARGKKIVPAAMDFRNSYIVATSNVGAEEIQRARKGVYGMGFNVVPTNTDIQKAGLEALTKEFSDIPEFLGRFSGNVVCFEELVPDAYTKILGKIIDRVNIRLKNEQNYLEITPDLANALINSAVGEGVYGARDLEAGVEKRIISGLADILQAYPLRGCKLIADLEDEELIFDAEMYPEVEDVEISVNEQRLPDTNCKNDSRKHKRRRKGGGRTAPEALFIGLMVAGLAINEIMRKKTVFKKKLSLKSSYDPDTFALDLNICCKNWLH